MKEDKSPQEVLNFHQGLRNRIAQAMSQSLECIYVGTDQPKNGVIPDWQEGEIYINLYFQKRVEDREIALQNLDRLLKTKFDDFGIQEEDIDRYKVIDWTETGWSFNPDNTFYVRKHERFKRWTEANWHGRVSREFIEDKCNFVFMAEKQGIQKYHRGFKGGSELNLYYDITGRTTITLRRFNPVKFEVEETKDFIVKDNYIHDPEVLRVIMNGIRIPD